MGTVSHNWALSHVTLSVVLSLMALSSCKNCFEHSVVPDKALSNRAEAFWISAEVVCKTDWACDGATPNIVTQREMLSRGVALFGNVSSGVLSSEKSSMQADEAGFISLFSNQKKNTTLSGVSSFRRKVP